MRCFKRVTSRSYDTSLTRVEAVQRFHSPPNPINQSINQSITHRLTNSFTHSLTHSLTQPINQSITRPLTHLLNQSINHSINQPISQSTKDAFIPIVSEMFYPHVRHFDPNQGISVRFFASTDPDFLGHRSLM